MNSPHFRICLPIRFRYVSFCYGSATWCASILQIRFPAFRSRLMFPNNRPILATQVTCLINNRFCFAYDKAESYLNANSRGFPWGFLQFSSAERVTIRVEPQVGDSSAWGCIHGNQFILAKRSPKKTRKQLKLYNLYLHLSSRKPFRRQRGIRWNVFPLRGHTGNPVCWRFFWYLWNLDFIVWWDHQDEQQ